MQTTRLVRTVVYALTAAFLLLFAAYIALLKTIDLDTFKGEILAELERSLRRPVSYKSGSLSFSLGPAVSLQEITVKEPDNSGDFVTISDLTCRLDLLQLLQKKLTIHGLVADKAVIRLKRHRDGTFNFSDLLKSSPSETAVKIHTLKLKNADITFTDDYLEAKPIISRFSETDLSLDDITRGAKGRFKLSTRLDDGTGGTLSTSGKIRLSPDGAAIGSSSIDAKITCRKLDSARYWPYYRVHVPFRKIAGRLDAEAEIHGQLNEFSSSGRLSLQGLRLEYPPVFRQAIASKSIQFKYSMELNKSDIIVKAVEADIDGSTIKGSCAIRDYRSTDPRITAQAVASRLDFAHKSQYIPYGIIVKDTAEWIEQHLAGGIFQLDEGRLDGKVSQILHMETGENYNVLYIKARVDKGVVSYGSAVPTFNNIKGTLELKGKDFFLHGMSGNFGTSPLTLEGSITDYPLNKPSAYPFRMVMSPTENEVDWLIGNERSRHLSFNGNSALTLYGEGFTSLYHLSGEWNLSPAAYSYANYIAKPVGKPSRIKFKGSISPKEATLTTLQYTVGALDLDLSARYPFDAANPLELIIKTNQFTIDSIAPLSPLLSRYQPSGKVQLSLRGRREPAAETFSWRGAVALKNAAMSYSESAKPVTDLTGSISFSDDIIESSQLTGKIGTSLFTGNVTVNGLEPLVLSSSFTSPQISLADFGFKLPQKTPLITKIRGDISLADNSLTIKSLSYNLNKSQLTVKGGISDIEQMKGDLAVTSPYLDISDVVLLQGVERSAATAAKPSPDPAFKTTVRAEKCTYRGLEFDKLTATVTLSNRLLQIQQLESHAFGGKLSIKGTIDAHTAPTKYQGVFKLANGSADQISEFISGDRNKKEITGIMSLEGDISASGDVEAALRRSASGSLKIHSVKGMIRQFSGLSKVFSILNVSQLFKFKLPDMVSDGMPYNEINGTLVFNDGTVSTDDLFVSSNAMNMSLVGKHDFIRDNLDMTLGIQPLQTVDKVVSSIPIVGWILTGKEKAMFSTYFEIKGKSTDPKVSAIPITSLGKGVLGIFKRAFQLPVKLFTDTGEVILGN